MLPGSQIALCASMAVRPLLVNELHGVDKAGDRHRAIDVGEHLIGNALRLPVLENLLGTGAIGRPRLFLFYRKPVPLAPGALSLPSARG